MKVRDLIEHLQRYPEMLDLDVIAQTRQGPAYDIEHPSYHRGYGIMLILKEPAKSKA